MSVHKNNSGIMLTCLDVSESTNMDEELYDTTLLGKTNNFEDWMEKAGVDCFFTKPNLSTVHSTIDADLSSVIIKDDIQFAITEDQSVQKPKKEINKPNILRSQNSKIDRNMNALGDSNKKFSKSEILTKREAAIIEMTVTEDVCTLIIKDADEKQVFLPQNIQVNTSNDQPSIQTQGFSKHQVTSMILIPIAKVNNDEKLPQLTTNIGAKFFLCPLPDCQEAFYHISNAKLHALKHMGVKPYKCDIPSCSWKFYTLFKLQRHKETHSTRKMFMCSHKNCNRGFTTVYNLKCHKKVHEKPASLECPVKDCTKLFQTEKERRTHCKMHNASEAPYKCDFQHCNKSFFTQMALQTHTRCHSHKDSELNCEFPNCGKTFHTPYRLKEHFRSHTGHRPYVCDYQDCIWRFPTASKLRRHQSTHTKDRKFHCTIGNCTKSFIRSEHLRDHTLTHIGQRSSECEACNISFNGKSALYTHNKKFHPEKKREVTATSSSKPVILELPYSIKSPQQTRDVLLEQAIQSLDVVNTPSDLSILGTSCLLPEDLLENDVNFSTVNLRDLD